ncbi:MAG: Lrp/AsnC family transcriptional regulator [Cloacibacillus sp.]
MIRYDISPDNDDIDNEIISELAKNCKITCKALSERVNISIPRIYERTKKLEEKGYIKGYHAEIDFKQLGYQVHTFVLIKTDKYVGAMLNELKKIDFVYDVWVVSGEYHYMLDVYTQNMDDLFSLLDYLYNNIGRTQTLFVMEH